VEGCRADGDGGWPREEEWYERGSPKDERGARCDEREGDQWKVDPGLPRPFGRIVRYQCLE
jgi:hypothetical protein